MENQQGRVERIIKEGDEKLLNQALAMLPTKEQRIELVGRWLADSGTAKEAERIIEGLWLLCGCDRAAFQGCLRDIYRRYFFREKGYASQTPGFATDQSRKIDALVLSKILKGWLPTYDRQDMRSPAVFTEEAEDCLLFICEVYNRASSEEIGDNTLMKEIEGILADHLRGGNGITAEHLNAYFLRGEIPLGLKYVMAKARIRFLRAEEAVRETAFLASISFGDLGDSSLPLIAEKALEVQQIQQQINQWIFNVLAKFANIEMLGCDLTALKAAFAVVKIKGLSRNIENTVASVQLARDDFCQQTGIKIRLEFAGPKNFSLKED